MFYLIGVNHDVQRHAPGAEFDAHQIELERCLSEAIEKCQPALIAVEESEDTLKEKRKGVCVVCESIPRNVARRHAIEPMLCEPSDAWKAEHGCMDSLTLHLELSVSDLLRGIPSDQEKAAVAAVAMALFFPLREEYWLEQFKDYLQSDVIFVVGENHIDSFSSRLQALGVQVKVLCRGIGVTDTNRAESAAAREFPAKNPGVFRRMLQHFKGSA
jgi:hypothetical protein